MKTFLTLVCVTLMSVSAFAEFPVPMVEPSEQTVRVVRALVNNPDIVSQLKANRSDTLSAIQILEVKHDVFKYTLIFDRSCFCSASRATVSILEDHTPTYTDGAIEYTSSISIKHGADIR